MPKTTGSLQGPFDVIVELVTKRILAESFTGTLEEQWNSVSGSTKCAVRVFERYSWTGSNRVSMNVTFLQDGKNIYYCAITSGGSRARFRKWHSWGERSFLKTFQTAVASLKDL
jgi:hypothetical protein